jgi:predicted DsbA family dithiol-disulfide isomerase
MKKKGMIFSGIAAIVKGASATPTFIIVNSNGQQQKLAGAQPYAVFKDVIGSMI